MKVCENNNCKKSFEEERGTQIYCSFSCAIDGHTNFLSALNDTSKKEYTDYHIDCSDIAEYHQFKSMSYGYQSLVLCLDIKNKFFDPYENPNPYEVDDFINKAELIVKNTKESATNAEESGIKAIRAGNIALEASIHYDFEKKTYAYKYAEKAFSGAKFAYDGYIKAEKWLNELKKKQGL